MGTVPKFHCAIGGDRSFGAEAWDEISSRGSQPMGSIHHEDQPTDLAPADPPHCLPSPPTAPPCSVQPGSIMWRALLRALLRLGHFMLLFLFLLTTRLLQKFVIGFYTFFPCKPLLDRLYQHSHGLRNLFSYHLHSDTPEDIVALVEAEGLYRVEHHQVTTLDALDPGLLWQAGHASRQSAFALRPARPPVLLQHGLMQNSEGSAFRLLCPLCLFMSEHVQLPLDVVWVVGDSKNSLAFALFHAGFDVWLGNNRGNKYSTKHTSMAPDTDEFWNFSLDELARHVSSTPTQCDSPSMIKYIVDITGFPKISYVGFSQGTAQFFASLSCVPEIPGLVSAFVALSAAVSVRGLSPSLLTSLIEANHDFLFFLFGRRAMLPLALNYVDMLNPSRYRVLLDYSMKFLFGWTAKEISIPRRERVYRHLYSTCSVKAVVHWFQIMRTGRFQMYDDGPPSPHRVPPVYDVSANHGVPTAVFLGLKDTVIDPKRLVQALPPMVQVHRLPSYEHLDMIWADSAGDQVFPEVTAFLQQYMAGCPESPP
eukprot:gene11180-2027_t